MTVVMSDGTSNLFPTQPTIITLISTTTDPAALPTDGVATDVEPILSPSHGASNVLEGPIYRDHHLHQSSCGGKERKV